MNKLSLAEQQVIMMGIADVIIDTFAMESAILRTQKHGAKDVASCYLDMTKVFCCDAIQRIEATVKNTLSAIDDRDVLSALLAVPFPLSQWNTVAARQRIAKSQVEGHF